MRPQTSPHAAETGPGNGDVSYDFGLLRGNAIVREVFRAPRSGKPTTREGPVRRPTSRKLSLRSDSLYWEKFSFLSAVLHDQQNVRRAVPTNFHRQLRHHPSVGNQQTAQRCQVIRPPLVHARHLVGSVIDLPPYGRRIDFLVANFRQNIIPRAVRVHGTDQAEPTAQGSYPSASATRPLPSRRPEEHAFRYQFLHFHRFGRTDG